MVGDKNMWETILQYSIIIAILIIISLVVIKVRKKDFNIEVNKLIGYLGGKDNIINAECNVKDVSLVDKEGITKLGAQGIVEIDNTLKIIFGKDAKQLKKYIDDLI